MTFRKYLVLAGVTLFAAIGDSFLARGMKQVGNVSLRHLPDMILDHSESLGRPGDFVFAGIFCRLHDCAFLGGSHLCSARDFPGICTAGSHREVSAARAGDHRLGGWVSL